MTDQENNRNSRITVHYRDGLALTFLFARSTRIIDLMAAIHRAGQVRKVALSEERTCLH